MLFCGVFSAAPSSAPLLSVCGLSCDTGVSIEPVGESKGAGGTSDSVGTSVLALCAAAGVTAKAAPQMARARILHAMVLLPVRCMRICLVIQAKIIAVTWRKNDVIPPTWLPRGNIAQKHPKSPRRGGPKHVNYLLSSVPCYACPNS